MHTLLIFSSVYQLSLLAYVNADVLFAANLDDFKYLAKKIIPPDLADQLADMVSQNPVQSRDNDRLGVASEAEQDHRETTKKKIFQVLNQDIDAIVEKVKEKLEKDYRKIDSITDKAKNTKYLELSIDTGHTNKRPNVNTNEENQQGNDTMQNRNEETQSKMYKIHNKKDERHMNNERQTKNDEHMKTEDYQIPLFEKKILRLNREKIAKQSRYEYSDEHKSNNEKYGAPQNHDDEDYNQQNEQEQKNLKQIKIYLNKNSEEKRYQNDQILRDAFKKEQRNEYSKDSKEKRPQQNVYENKRQEKYAYTDYQYPTDEQRQKHHKDKKLKHEDYRYDQQEHVYYQSKHDTHPNLKSKHGYYEVEKLKHSYLQQEQPKRGFYKNEQREYKYYGKEKPKRDSFQYERQDHDYYEKIQPKSNHNKQTKHDYNEKEQPEHDGYQSEQSKHESRNEQTKNECYEKEQPKRDSSQIRQQKQEDYENERPKHESIQRERPRNKNKNKKKGHLDLFQNEQLETNISKKATKAKNFPNYDEFSDNVKVNTDTKQVNTDSFGNGVSLLKHDSYEDYVTPKKDNPYDTSDEKTSEPTPKVRTTKKTNQHDDSEEVSEDNAKLNTFNMKEKQKDGQGDVKAKTENLFYEDLATDNTKRPVKNTMIPTKMYYRFSSPNYYAKLVTPAEKYDFDEPLPEKDREKENLKSFPNLPASINGKRGLKV